MSSFIYTFVFHSKCVAFHCAYMVWIWVFPFVFCSHSIVYVRDWSVLFFLMLGCCLRIFCPPSGYFMLFSLGATFPSSPALCLRGRFSQQEVQERERERRASFPAPHFSHPTSDTLPGCDFIYAGNSFFHDLLITPSLSAIHILGMLTVSHCC